MPGLQSFAPRHGSASEAVPEEPPPRRRLLAGGPLPGPLAAALLALLASCGPLPDRTPYLAATPEVLHLRAAPQAGSASAPLTLINLGEASLEIRQLTLAISTGYTVQGPPLPFSVAPGGEIALAVHYRPGPGAPLDNVLEIETDFTALRVELKALAAAAVLAIEPGQVDFGAVPSGSRSGRLVSLHNLGLATAEDLRLEWVEAGSDFEARLSATRLPPGGRADLLLGYAPRGGDSDRALLRVRWDSGGELLRLSGHQDLRAPD